MSGGLIRRLRRRGCRRRSQGEASLNTRRWWSSGCLRSALASLGETLELPFVHGGHQSQPVLGRCTDPRAAENIGVAQCVHVRPILVDPGVYLISSADGPVARPQDIDVTRHALEQRQRGEVVLDRVSGVKSLARYARTAVWKTAGLRGLRLAACRPVAARAVPACSGRNPGIHPISRSSSVSRSSSAAETVPTLDSCSSRARQRGVEPTLGFEPRTCCLRNSCSTAELCRRRTIIGAA
jgi:hypothetical protein